MTFEILAVDIENLLMTQKELVGHEARLHLLLLKNKFLNIFYKEKKKNLAKLCPSQYLYQFHEH